MQVVARIGRFQAQKDSSRMEAEKSRAQLAILLCLTSRINRPQPEIRCQPGDFALAPNSKLERNSGELSRSRGNLKESWLALRYL